jgi:O-antigen/teichoic acid export membrane protein
MIQFTRTVVRNSAFGLSAQLIIKLLSFGFSVLIVRSLGAEAFGQYMAVLAFGSMFVFLSDLGLSPYAVREVARWRNAPDQTADLNAVYGNLLALRFLLAILATTLVVLTAWLTGRPMVMVLAIALSGVGLVVYSLEGTSEAILSAFERLDLVATAKVLYQLVFVAVGALVLWNGVGYYGLIIANVLGIALMTYACWRGASKLGLRFGRPTVHTWPALLRASLPFGVIGFTLGLSYKFDTVLLNIFRNDSETGYYNAAYNLVFSTVMISNVINTALYPSLARQSTSDAAALPRIYERVLRYLMIMALPIAVGGWALAEQIVPFLFTATYLAAIPALEIVIWVIPLMFASEFLGYIVVISNNEGRVAQAVIFSTAFNVVFNLALVPRFGFVGAAVMTVITEAVLVGQYVWMLRAQLRQIHWSHTLLRPLAAALMMGGVVLALRGLPLLLNIAIGALTYGALLLTLGVIGGDELRFVHSLRQSTEGEPSL